MRWMSLTNPSNQRLPQFPSRARTHATLKACHSAPRSFTRLKFRKFTEPLILVDARKSRLNSTHAERNETETFLQSNFADFLILAAVCKPLIAATDNFVRMKTFSKWLLITPMVALALLAATSKGSGSGNWSCEWIKFKPFRCDIGPRIYGLDHKGKRLVDGRFYLFGPILITHFTNAPLVKPSEAQ
jgi:hypothetical protein